MMFLYRFAVTWRMSWRHSSFMTTIEMVWYSDWIYAKSLTLTAFLCLINSSTSGFRQLNYVDDHYFNCRPILMLFLSTCSTKSLGKTKCKKYCKRA